MHHPVILQISPALDTSEAMDELSDSDLEQVVGGLSRAWPADTAAVGVPAPASFSVVTLASLDAMRRIPA